jgi:transposase
VIEQLNPDDLVYMDETGIDSSLQREYARTKRGNKVKSDICGKKLQRTSVIAAWSRGTKSIIAPYVFDGYTDSKRFNGWVKKCLLPELKKGQTVVMDNAPFHKSKITKELIESVGCKLLYLPTYSPDFNPIEHIWAMLKQKYRTQKRQGYEHDDAINRAFLVC